MLIYWKYKAREVLYLKSVISSSFSPDPDPKQIIPDPGKVLDPARSGFTTLLVQQSFWVEPWKFLPL